MLTVEFDRIPLAPGMHVLDAGCGAGRHLCEAFRTAGVVAVGVDLREEDLSTARGYLSLMGEGLNRPWLVAKADVTRLPFADSAFDVVICSEVLEHIEHHRVAIAELVRVLKPAGLLAVTVPRFGPERLCWSLSRAYHEEAGGHIKIFRKARLLEELHQAGTRCQLIRYRHSLHAPYWWLRCIVGHKNERFMLVRWYKTFLEWDILQKPRLLALLDRLLNPLIGKSIVFYLRKEQA